MPSAAQQHHDRHASQQEPQPAQTRGLRARGRRHLALPCCLESCLITGHHFVSSSCELQERHRPPKGVFFAGRFDGSACPGHTSPAVHPRRLPPVGTVAAWPRRHRLAAGSRPGLPPACAARLTDHQCSRQPVSGPVRFDPGFQVPAEHLSVRCKDGLQCVSRPAQAAASGRHAARGIES